jgi:tryptophan synthase alpha chain
MTSICEHSTGFVYCVTVTGITGARSELPAGMKDLLAEVKKHTDLPVAAGFGISRPDHMKALRGSADAAVVGSAIVAEIDQGGDAMALVKELLKACR